MAGQRIILRFNNEEGEEKNEVWGTLTEVCLKKKFSHNYLKKKKFPFIYREITFIKVPYNDHNGIPIKPIEDEQEK